jgi:hypothetical protein
MSGSAESSLSVLRAWPVKLPASKERGKMPNNSGDLAWEGETLKEEAAHIIEEARMILPGVQALFGFQLIAVFNQRYVQLPSIGNVVHLVSLVLISVAIALIMAPAAYHRIAEPGRASRQLIQITSALICAAMLPLMLGLTLDVFVVCLFMTSKEIFSLCISLSLLCVFLAAWFLLPLSMRRHFQSEKKRLVG